MGTNRHDTELNPSLNTRLPGALRSHMIRLTGPQKDADGYDLLVDRDGTGLGRQADIERDTRITKLLEVMHNEFDPKNQEPITDNFAHSICHSPARCLEAHHAIDVIHSYQRYHQLRTIINSPHDLPDYRREDHLIVIDVLAGLLTVSRWSVFALHPDMVFIIRRATQMLRAME